MTMQPDRLAQADQMGRPGINTVFNHGNDKNLFNVTQPANHRNMISTVDPTTGRPCCGFPTRAASVVGR
jgi:hypothetical protein